MAIYLNVMDYLLPLVNNVLIICLRGKKQTDNLPQTKATLFYCSQYLNEQKEPNKTNNITEKQNHH